MKATSTVFSILFTAIFLFHCSEEPSSQNTGSSGQEEVPIPENMVKIPGGTFSMGSDEEIEYGYKTNDDERPVHSVKVDAFHMGKYPVTQKEYTAIIDNNPASYKHEDAPIDNINWYDAALYCNKRSIEEGLEPVYYRKGEIADEDSETGNSRKVISWDIKYEKNGYRLPTEAEWEYAIRAGRDTQYFWGEDTSHATVDSFAVYEGNMGDTDHIRVVGQRLPNDFGLYDMGSNVGNWCNDWYSSQTYEEGVDEMRRNPTGPAKTTATKVARGGSYMAHIKHLRCAFRGEMSPIVGFRGLGFRIVRSVDTE
ncbi:MAG: formylglycine-generating enzyme family protein [Fibrobacterota bacterium]